MKKILMAAVAALAIVGCTQNEEIENVGNKAEINFGTIVSKTTRAAVTTIDSLQKSGFTVYAYNTGETEMKNVAAKGLGTPFMNGVAATYSAKWELAGGPYYWPFNSNVQFFAYATDASATYKLNDSDIYPIITYTINEDASKQKDFVVAQLINQKKTESTVKLSFLHALTQVNFSAKGSNADLKYTISSISIEGVANTGTYSFADSTWTVTGTAGKYIYPTAENAPVSGTTVADLDQAKGALMLMPQAMSTSSKIKVSYNVYNSKDVQIDEVTDAVISLDKTANWEVGKKVRYTLTLSSEGATISFAPEVGNWNTNDDTPVTPPAE